MEGNEITGVTISITGESNAQTTTDANGRYLFEDIPVGDSTVAIADTPSGVTCPDTTQAATVTDDSQVAVDWTCEGTATLS